MFPRIVGNSETVIQLTQEISIFGLAGLQS